MAFTGTAFATSYKVELLKAVHNFSAAGGDAFKMALYTNSAAMDANTTAYSATNEITGVNYVAGGMTLTNLEPTPGGTTGYAQFANAIFNNVTLTAAGALIYNSSKGNKAVIVIDFGGDKSMTEGDFTVKLPTFDSVHALIRLV